jgi:hypothetical protein
MLVPSTVVLAGCSSSDETDTPGAQGPGTDPPTETPTPTASPTPTPTPEFETTVFFPVGGVVGEPVPIEVTVTNAGEGAGEYEARLTHDGSELASETASVDPGESVTITLEHTFSSEATYDVAAAGEEATLSIFEHGLRFVHEAMTNADTLVVERTVTERGMIDIGEGPTNWAKDSTATVEKNYEAETLYEKSEDDLVYGSTDLKETVEKWVVDGVLYEKKTKHTEGSVEYDRRITDRPRAWSALSVHGTDTEAFLGREHTDEEYVFVFDPSTSEEVTALTSRTIGEGGFFPAETATDARLELRYDRGTGRATTVDSELTLEGADVFPELDRSYTDTYGAYGDPVEVTVPDDVEENT